MNRKSIWFLVATATFVLIGSSTAWAVSTPINLLRLGSSTTYFGLYDAPLRTSLGAAGYTVTNDANQGHSGYIIQGNLTGAPRAGLLESINTYMNYTWANSANTYILLLIGANDVDTGYKLNSTDVPNVQTRLSSLIAAIESIAPKAHLIVSQLGPIVGSVAKDTLVKQFNRDVVASVATAKALGWNVSTVDMYTPLNDGGQYAPNTGIANPYYGDSLHVNQLGGNIMAQVWFNGIQSIQSQHTPEPSTLVLFSTAALLATLTYVRRKRRA